MTPAGPQPAGTIRVNGALRPWDGGTLADLLRETGHDPTAQGIAIAQNGEVVSRSVWAQRSVAPGDVVEVVGAVQGG